MSKINLICVILILSIVSFTIAQDNDGTSLDGYLKQPKREVGFVFSMAETGSGVGAFLALPFGNRFHVGATLDAFFIRDSKQVEVIDPIYGGVYTLNKENDVYIFDLVLTIKRRFFAEDVDDGFRPFLAAGFGPTFGMNFPEDESKANQFRWTMGGFVGGGVDVSVSSKYFVSARAQYRIIPFSSFLGETTNHSMFELRFEIGQRF